MAQWDWEIQDRGSRTKMLKKGRCHRGTGGHRDKMNDRSSEIPGRGCEGSDLKLGGKIGSGLRTGMF
jgi:hypothetical protein